MRVLCPTVVPSCPILQVSGQELELVKSVRRPRTRRAEKGCILSASNFRGRGAGLRDHIGPRRISVSLCREAYTRQSATGAMLFQRTKPRVRKAVSRTFGINSSLDSEGLSRLRHFVLSLFAALQGPRPNSGYLIPSGISGSNSMGLTCNDSCSK